MGYAMGYGCCKPLCDAGLDDSKYIFNPTGTAANWIFNSPECFSGTIAVSQITLTDACFEPDLGHGGYNLVNLVLSASFGCIFSGNQTRSFGDSNSGTLVQTGKSATLTITAVKAGSACTEIAVYQCADPNFVNGNGTFTLVSATMGTWPATITTTGTPSGTKPNTVSSIAAGSARALMTAQARQGKQDFQVTAAVIPNGKSQQAGIFIGAAFALWIDWTSLDVFYAPTDLVGTIKQNQAVKIGTLTSAVQQYLTIACFQNVKGDWNFFFAYFTTQTIIIAGQNSQAQLWDIPGCFVGSIGIGGGSITGGCLVSPASLPAMNLTGTTCTFTGSSTAGPLTFSATLVQAGTTAVLTITMTLTGANPCSDTATYTCPVFVNGSGTFNLIDAVCTWPLKIIATPSPTGLSCGLTQAGDIWVGMTAGYNGGVWNLPAESCAPATCATCDDGTPLNYALTVGTDDPVNLIQAPLTDGSRWVPSSNCYVYACVFGKKDTVLPPVTPTTNPVKDFIGIDGGLDSKPQLMKWPFSNRNTGSSTGSWLGSYAYSVITDSKIHYLLIVAPDQTAGALPGIQNYSPQGVYIAAVVRGNMCLCGFGGVWNVTVAVGNYLTVPGGSFVVQVTSGSPVYPGTFVGQGVFPITSGGTQYRWTITVNQIGGEPPNPGAQLSVKLEEYFNPILGWQIILLDGANYKFPTPWFPPGGGNTYTTLTGVPSNTVMPSTLQFDGVDVGNWVNYYQFDPSGGVFWVNPTIGFVSTIALWTIPYTNWCCYGTNTLTRIYPDEALVPPWPALGPVFHVPAGGGYLEPGYTGIDLAANASTPNWQDGSATLSYFGEYRELGMGAAVGMEREFPDSLGALYVAPVFDSEMGPVTFTLQAWTQDSPTPWPATIIGVRTAFSATFTISGLTLAFNLGSCKPVFCGGLLLSEDPAGTAFPDTVTVKAVLPTTIPCQVECLWASADLHTWYRAGSYTGQILTTPCPDGTKCDEPDFDPQYVNQHAYTFCA